jgi:predicted PurR-regulated permease PerM
MTPMQSQDPAPDNPATTVPAAGGPAEGDTGSSRGPDSPSAAADRPPASCPPGGPDWSGTANPVTRFGIPGAPVNRGHPFYIGFMGALGVLLAWWLVNAIDRLSSVLTLLVTALFLSLGLDSVVQRLQGMGLHRRWAILTVVSGVLAVFVGFVSAVIPPLVDQTTAFSTSLPGLVNDLMNSDTVMKWDKEYGLFKNLNDQIQERLTSGDTALQLFGGVFGAGKAIVSSTFNAFTVLVLTVYFLGSMHKITDSVYRMFPRSRRDRVRLLGDEIIRRIGGYIIGQMAVATINGVCTFFLLTAIGVDYPLVLAIIVGLLGLIPLVGATLGAAIVLLVALFDSWKIALVVLVYYVIYQQVENYVISPRIMARTVAVPGAIAVVAALAGGTLLGILGALLAIPVAAGILLIIEEVFMPRQESS